MNADHSVIFLITHDISRLKYKVYAESYIVSCIALSILLSIHLVYFIAIALCVCCVVGVFYCTNNHFHKSNEFTMK